MIADANHPNLGLFTDLYELTMLQGFLEEGMTDNAVFTLFVRRLPESRNYLLACGLEPVLAYLEQLRFTDDDIAYLRSLDRFSERLLRSLRELRFEGDIYAVPEGTPVFADEPILEVVAPIHQGQVVETLVMNQIHLETVLASKASRIVMAARGRTVIDFGARRTHGIDAALKGARAFHIAGVHGTSNVLAGKIYGVPVAGTMAHSYVQAHDDEREAFRAFARTFPGTILIVDTYDTLDGVRHVIELAKQAPKEFKISGVRLDSGDLAALGRQTRHLLDEAGLEEIEIFASSGLDEHKIDALVNAGVPIDGFGVGTGMGVSSDAPSLDIAYKLSEYAGEGRTKLSIHKPILPGRKQVFRQEEDGRAIGDVIGRSDEVLGGRPLLQRVMRNGQRVPETRSDLESARRRAADELARLSDHVTSLQPADPPYAVNISPALQQFHAEVRAKAKALRSGV
ncbi:MAG: nicotinate phosphoribosyltransferase [Acidobacteria bacterium]|nr:MAG: nicotinate phosphoribosyltransferase [Acidobacteriota bacterium]